MPWTLLESFLQDRGTFRKSSFTMNAGQYIAVQLSALGATDVTPWGVLHIGVALPAIATVTPIIRSVLLYTPVCCYQGESGIGNGAAIATYIQKTCPFETPIVLLYRFT